MRKEPLVNDRIYHVFTKSIAGFMIFRSSRDYLRMLGIIEYYHYGEIPMKFSTYRKLKEKRRQEIIHGLRKAEPIVDIIAYCIMPTHVHLVLCQLRDRGISDYMKNLLNSYTRYFNTKNRRKGPLWQGRFKSVLVETDEQLLHLTRYVHLNPMTEGLVDRPGDWPYSSYREYVNDEGMGLCSFHEYLSLAPREYREFVESHGDYQKDLAKIKDLILE